MKNQLKIAIVAAVAAGLAGYGIYTATQNEVIETTQSQEQSVVESKINISDNGKLVVYDGVEGETALATLRSLTDVKAETSEFGEFVTGIGDVVANSENNEFWAFYVNEEQASVGAGSYTAVAGDKIEWKLETF